MPSIEERVAPPPGYPVRAIMMPIIPVEGWEDLYEGFTHQLLEIPIQCLTLGSICIYRGARDLMERRMGRKNVISQQLDATSIAGDGRLLAFVLRAPLLYDVRWLAARDSSP